MEVAVIASRARTGSACVESLAKKGFKVRAVSRGGNLTPEQQNNPNIIPYKGDVTKIETIEQCIEGAKVVVFAASASAGWRFPSSSRNDTPPHVDYQGCINVAKACAESKTVEQYIIISSACVSRSMFTSVPYFLLNTLFGRIMFWKYKAEEETKEILSNSNCCYTIIRPGGLTDEPPNNPNQLQLLTGDLKSGRISRNSVGEIVAAAVNNSSSKNKVFECVNGTSDCKSYSDLFSVL